MRKAAAEAAEARKGFEVVTEGQITSVPLIYGRAKVGGTRVWCNTKSSHSMPSSYTSAARVFDIGSSGTIGASYTYTVDVDGIPTELTRDVDAISPGNLGVSLSGSKNEFLYFQQVLCHGPINKVVDFVVDESRFADDPALGQSGLNVAGDLVKAGFRTEVHYDGSVANEMISGNFPERGSAKFPGLAYASTVIRLNRDEPQFSGQIPNVQYFIEGRKVRKVVSGALTTVRTYSNNPAWCLLDYLLETNDRTFNGNRLFDSGKSLDISLLDLASFEAAAAICDTIALSNKKVYGNVWKATDGSTNIDSRDIPLYECNIVIDTTKPVRENVEAILSTMGDARLVWSGGKYKVSLQYPASNEALVYHTITDDDIPLGASIQMTWPSASERLNHATVKFSNESENFKEDSVSWPPKAAGIVYKGIGDKRYPVSDATTGILADYGVWAGTGNSADFVWKFRAKATGSHTMNLQIDNYGTLLLKNESGSVLLTLTATDFKTMVSGSVALVADTIYTVEINATNTGFDKGVAARLLFGSTTYWTTRDAAYTSFEVVNQSSALYDTFKAEDSGLELETEVFLEGCTDYFHALAKAEELVRTSRSAVGVSFSYIVKDRFFEPGDFIKLDSETLHLGDAPFFLRVNEVKMEGQVAQISGARFDYSQLAWNVSDNEYKVPANRYSFEIPAPSNFTYSFENTAELQTSGRLTWDPVGLDSLAGYIIYVNTYDDFDIDGQPLFREVGRSTSTFFDLPAYKYKSAIFGIRSVSKANRTSKLVTTGVTAYLLPDLSISRAVAIKPLASTAFVKARNALTALPTSLSFLAETSGFTSPVFKWFVDGVEDVSSTTDTYVLESFTGVSSKLLKVQVTEAGETTLSEDYLTVLSLQEGSDAYTLTAVETNVAIAANADGSYKNFTLPYTIATNLYQGSSLLTAQLYELDTYGCVASVSSSGVVSISSISEAVATITVEATINGTLVILPIRIFVVRDGQAATPRIARIGVTRLAFLTPKNSSTPTPSTITASSNSSGFIAPSYQWYVDGSMVSSGLSASSYDLSAFATGQKTIKLIVTETAPSNAINGDINGITSEDTLSVYSLKEGDDAYNLNIVDENRTLPGDYNGTILSGYKPYSTLAVLTRGTEILSGTPRADVTWSIQNKTTTLNVTITNTGAITVNDLTGVLSGVATIRAVVAGVGTFEKVLKVSIAPQGQPSYTWIKYADDASGTGLSDSATNKRYIGIATNKSTATESVVATDYTWSLIKGDQGVQGVQGIQGIQGPQGPQGQSAYTWIKYADTSAGAGISDYPSGKSYIGVAYNKTTAVESNFPADYEWALIKGDQGIQGPVGPQGQPSYTWIKYADDASGTGLSDDSTGKKYIGIAPNKTTAVESTTATDYTWSLIKGDQGIQGIQGIQGPQGQPTYTWIKYADDASGTGLSDYPSGKRYLGVAYNKTTAVESTIASDYSWSLIQGDQGIQGPVGPQGQPTYTWIKYADDASGTGMSDSAVGKSYIGIAPNKTTATESTVAADYTWSLIKGDKGDQGIPGATGKTVVIDISGITNISKNAGGAFTPATIPLTAVATNVTSPAYSWTITGATITTGTSTSSAITLTPDSNVSQISVTLSVTGTELTSAASVTRKMAVTYDGQPGQAGSSGVMSAFPTIYKWNAGTTAPSNPVNPASSVYTWATGSFPLPSGWYASAPTNTTADQTLWEITIPLPAVSATVVTSPLDWAAAASTMRATSRNAINGTNGAGTYVLVRTTSTNGISAPTSGEFSGIANRNPVDGDVITVTNTTTNTSAIYKYVVSSWSTQATYITGSLIVQRTITADRLVANSITANEISSSYIYTNALNAAQITAGTISASASRGSLNIVGSNAILEVRRTSNTTLPSLYVNDTAGASVTGAGWFDSNTTGTTLSVDNTGSSGTALSAVSYGSGSGAAIFKNQGSLTSGVPKQFWAAPGLYAAYSPANGGKYYFVDGVGPFTGMHDGLLLKNSTATIGDILVDKQLIYAVDVANTVFEVELSTAAYQKGAIGVFNEKRPVCKMAPASLWNYVSRKEQVSEMYPEAVLDETNKPILDQDGNEIVILVEKTTEKEISDFEFVDGLDLSSIENTYDVLSINALGEGQINVCGENGDIDIGDFITTSSIAGKGMKQTEDYQRSCTVAKSRVSVKFDFPTQVKMIPCIYLCG